MKKIVVTKIINKYEILLNVGQVDGIRKESKFDVIGKLDDVIDPITHESLGGLPYSKVRLKVKTLFPKMCICEDEQNCDQAEYLKMLSSGIFQANTVKNELNFDIDDYVDQQVDKAIYLNDEVLLLESEPKREIQNYFPDNNPRNQGNHS